MAKAVIINTLIDELGLSLTAFEDEIGAGHGTLRVAIRDDKELSHRITEKIISKYPNVSKTWLLTGEGDMFTTKITSSTPVKSEAFDLGPIGDYEESVEITKSGNEFVDMGGGMYEMRIPKVEINAYAGYEAGFPDVEFLEKLPKHEIVVDRMYRGAYRAFVVKGDSMTDDSPESIEEGDIVTGRIIDKSLWRSTLHLHKFRNFVIVHREGIIVKQILKHDAKNGIITVHSLNTDKATYPDRPISLSDVDQLLNITHVTKKTRVTADTKKYDANHSGSGGKNNMQATPNGGGLGITKYEQKVNKGIASQPFDTESPYLETFRELLPTPENPNNWLPGITSMDNIKKYWSQTDKLFSDRELIDTMMRENPNNFYHIPDVKAEFTITVREDNMKPRYMKGQILALKRIEKKSIRPGFPYYVIFTDGDKHIYIIKGSAGVLSFESTNSNDFPPFPGTLDDIQEVYKIQGHVSIESQD